MDKSYIQSLRKNQKNILAANLVILGYFIAVKRFFFFKLNIIILFPYQIRYSLDKSNKKNILVAGATQWRSYRRVFGANALL
jgi:hypothetical protein